MTRVCAPVEGALETKGEQAVVLLSQLAQPRPKGRAAGLQVSTVKAGYSSESR